MVAFLKGLSPKTIFIGLFVIYVLCSVGYIWLLRSDIKTYQENVAKLEMVNTMNQKVIAQLKTDYDQIREVNETVQQTLNLRNKELKDVSVKLSKLEKLTVAKPQLIEKRVNNASNKIIQCFKDIANDKECE